MKVNMKKQSFWTRKWALQPVRFCCRGKRLGRTQGKQ